jgi:hypothetical protein
MTVRDVVNREKPLIPTLHIKNPGDAGTARSTVTPAFSAIDLNQNTLMKRLKSQGKGLNAWGLIF